MTGPKEYVVVFVGCLALAWFGLLEAFPVLLAGAVAAAFATGVVTFLLIVDRHE